jgi:hypothetical protein
MNRQERGGILREGATYLSTILEDLLTAKIQGPVKSKEYSFPKSVKPPGD